MSEKLDSVKGSDNLANMVNKLNLSIAAVNDINTRFKNYLNETETSEEEKQKIINKIISDLIVQHNFINDFANDFSAFLYPERIAKIDLINENTDNNKIEIEKLNNKIKSLQEDVTNLVNQKPIREIFASFDPSSSENLIYKVSPNDRGFIIPMPTKYTAGLNLYDYETYEDGFVYYATSLKTAGYHTTTAQLNPDIVVYKYDIKEKTSTVVWRSTSIWYERYKYENNFTVEWIKFFPNKVLLIQTNHVEEKFVYVDLKTGKTSVSSLELTSLALEYGQWYKFGNKIVSLLKDTITLNFYDSETNLKTSIKQNVASSYSLSSYVDIDDETYMRIDGGTTWSFHLFDKNTGVRRHNFSVNVGRPYGNTSKDLPIVWFDKDTEILYFLNIFRKLYITMEYNKTKSNAEAINNINLVDYDLAILSNMDIFYIGIKNDGQFHRLDFIDLDLETGVVKFKKYSSTNEIVFDMKSMTFELKPLKDYLFYRLFPLTNTYNQYLNPTISMSYTRFQDIMHMGLTKDYNIICPFRNEPNFTRVVYKISEQTDNTIVTPYELKSEIKDSNEYLYSCHTDLESNIIVMSSKLGIHIEDLDTGDFETIDHLGTEQQFACCFVHNSQVYALYVISETGGNRTDYKIKYHLMRYNFELGIYSNFLNFEYDEIFQYYSTTNPLTVYGWNNNYLSKRQNVMFDHINNHLYNMSVVHQTYSSIRYVDMSISLETGQMRSHTQYSNSPVKYGGFYEIPSDNKYIDYQNSTNYFVYCGDVILKPLDNTFIAIDLKSKKEMILPTEVNRKVPQGGFRIKDNQDIEYYDTTFRTVSFRMINTLRTQVIAQVKAGDVISYTSDNKDNSYITCDNTKLPFEKEIVFDKDGILKTDFTGSFYGYVRAWIKQ